MNKSLFKKANILIFSVLISLFIFAGCQDSLASIGKGYSVSGTVTDSSGSPLQNVTITLVDAYGVEPVVTDSAGEYNFDDVPRGSYSIRAEKGGLYIYPKYNALTIDGNDDPINSRLSVVSVLYSNQQNINFVGVSTSELSIPMIQGYGDKSPFEGQEVTGITGVVTKVTYKERHFLYDTALYDGSTTPQYVGRDGFYLQEVGAGDSDISTSDAIFVSTHNPVWDDSKWLESVPTDIKEGDVVSVSGTVTEYKPTDRFGNNEGFLTVTQISDPTVFHVMEDGSNKNIGLPTPVRLSNSVPNETVELRELPWEIDGNAGITQAIKLYESLEGMLVTVEQPLVVGGAYYNVAAVLADNGKGNGSENKDKTVSYNRIENKLTPNGGIHIKRLSNGQMDFNPEIIYVDYMSAKWKTFSEDFPLCQQGDSLKADNDSDSDISNNTLTGVIDYTENAIYWISPLITSDYHEGFKYDEGVVANDINLSNSEKEVANDPRMKSYNTSGNSELYYAPFTSVLETSGNSFDSNSDYLTVAEYNIENFENKGSLYDKVMYIAHNMVNNMGSPDIITLTEMGDENDSVGEGSVFYKDQKNSYYIKDGFVSAVPNYQALIREINKIDSSLNYDFREIAPLDGQDGGKPGTNIRTGFLFNKDRVTFMDRGIQTNTIDNTTAVVYPSNIADTLATSSTSVYRDDSGNVHLSQSPGRIQGSIFGRGTRKSLAGEFLFNGETVFVVVNHFKSKRGDSTIFGTTQPPVMGSEYKRGEQAKTVNSFIDKILAFDSDANIVVTGDFNDFQFSDVLRKLSGAYSGKQILWNMSEEFLPVEEQYSYSYKGNYQQLDHIYATKNLIENHIPSGYGTNNPPVWIGHINSHFNMMNHFEFSDHDPIVAVFELPQE